jgi:hypothetical protein
VADEPVNLRRYRKRKRRDTEARRAAENRVRHGETPAEREARERVQARETRWLEGHRAETPPDGGSRGSDDSD